MPGSVPTAGWRATLAVALAGALAPYGALIQFGLLDQFAAQYPDPYKVIALQERLEPVLARIPVTERVGFVSDVPFSDSGGQAAFFALQYAAAPRIAVREDAPEAAGTVYWVGIFSAQFDFVQFAVQRGFLIEQDLQNHVVLLRKPGARQ